MIIDEGYSLCDEDQGLIEAKLTLVRILNHHHYSLHHSTITEALTNIKIYHVHVFWAKF